MDETQAYNQLAYDYRSFVIGRYEKELTNGANCNTYSRWLNCGGTRRTFRRFSRALTSGSQTEK